MKNYERIGDSLKTFIECLQYLDVNLPILSARALILSLVLKNGSGINFRNTLKIVVQYIL